MTHVEQLMELELALETEVLVENLAQCNFETKQHIPWPLIMKRIIPNDWPPLGEVSANFCGVEGRPVVSATDPHGRYSRLSRHIPHDNTPRSNTD
jgi:hypothetical protein